MRVVGSRLLWRFKLSCAVALGLTALLALLAGCGTSDNYVYGTPVISIGDVSGDFTSYIVDIDEITFTRDDGYVIEPLSTPEQLDLTKLTNMSELLEAPAFPYGTYTSMTLILDYSSPDITLNVDGSVRQVVALDTAGDEMSTQSVTVNFDPQHPLVISPNTSTAFNIDIDLAAMNTVVYTTANGFQTTVQPFLTASVLPVAETGSMRARGLLVIAQPNTSDFIMNIRPFNDLVSALGALTVNTSPTTYFNVNGHTYVGAAGLQALTPTNATNTPTVAYGSLDNLSGITPTFNATAVYVGTSEESLEADYVTGTVGAINGGTLSLNGVSYVSRYGVLSYYGSAPVYVNSTTYVFQDGVVNPNLTPASISIGQQITVGGQATENSTTSDLEYLDATDGGLVRLQSTQLWGTLNSATTGSISLDLLSIDDFEPKDFNFTGTGISRTDDAVPSSYRIDSGTFDATTLPAGTLLQVNGMVTPFGTAPPDFGATSVVEGSTVPATMVFEYGTAGGGVREPFLELNSSELALNLKLADSVHYIQTGPTRINLTSQAEVPTVTYASGGTLVLGVGSSTAGINTFNEPASFVSSVFTFHDAGDLVYRVVCVGQYNAAAKTFAANRVDVAIGTGD